MENNPETNQEQDENIAKDTAKNAIATINKPLSELIKNSTGQLIVFQDKEATEAKLKALVEQYQTEINELVEIPELTPQQLLRSKTIRAVYRETRLELQRVEKHNSKTLNDAKTDKKNEIEEFVEIVLPSETKIDAKIKIEENRKAEERRIAEENETKRKNSINKKITDAGIAFERLILIGKTQEDLDKFDKDVSEFEDDLDSLDEFAYEGNELIERVKPRRSEIFDRVEAIRLQALKDVELESKDEQLAGKETKLDEKEKQLQERENNLKQMEESAAKTKARIEKIIGLGLVFNGMQYVKDDFNISVVELTTKNDAEFETMITNIANEMTRRSAAAAKAENNMQAYIALKDDYLLHTGKELALDVPIVTDELLAAVNAAIEAGKTESAQEAQRQKLAAIKNVGLIVFPTIEIQSNLIGFELEKHAEIIKGNEDAQKIIIEFMNDMYSRLNKLRSDLYQE